MLEVGLEWLLNEVDNVVETIDRLSPTEFNEANRYLPSSVTSIPGFLSYNVNPFMREIVDCFDIDSPVREVNVMKGVQITYTTLLESVMLYYMAHVKTLPMMYMTADKELASARVENNIIPMLNHSGFAHIIRSSDDGNSRKTGKTASHLQYEGGGYLVPFGARNADKMRAYSMAVMLKDEIDAWAQRVGKDGDPDKLSDDRCSGYWGRRKIGRGSTPLIEGISKIHYQYKRGDQRKYMVLCKSCSFEQSLRWEKIDKETGIIGGMHWDMEDGTLLQDSVRYACVKCGHEHYEYDKRLLFSPDEGAHWSPTAKPVEPFIRSYHLPALYSPIGMAPWSKCVADYLKGYDPKRRKVIDIEKYQGFYNNILGMPFRMEGTKVEFQKVSAHRRPIYQFGEIPNAYALKHSYSPILMLTCTVDVHKGDLAVSIMGWTRNMCCYVIDYWRFEDRDCTEISSPVWERLRKLIEETVYTADDGKKYRVAITLIDAGYKKSVVTAFAATYAEGVHPILGRQSAVKSQNITEFGEFNTQSGVTGYNITVDHYKDRLSPVLRRRWRENDGVQDAYHFNAPMDITDDQLTELTVESRVKYTDKYGIISHRYHRPSGVNNELWDLLVYGSAAVEMLAWGLCIQHFELEEVDWVKFWQFIEDEKLYFTE